MQTLANTGDQLLERISALANPHRLRIIAALSIHGHSYISQLARELGMSRPLMHLHLRKLEEAGLVKSRMELSKDGKAHHYFEVVDFRIDLTPPAIAEAVRTLASPNDTFDP